MANGRSAMTRGKGTSGKGALGKDPYGRSVPGFLADTPVPTAEARSYANWNKRVGPSKSSRPISLPSGGKDS